MTTLNYADAPTPWTPQPEVRDHMGAALPPGREFFAAPPPEIGKITNAFSTLKSTAYITPIWVKLGIAILCGLITAGIAAVIMSAAHLNPQRDALYIPLVVILALSVPLIVLLTFKWRHFCSYVGEDGIACFYTSPWSMMGGRKVGRSAKVVFPQAVALTTHQIRQYVNGIYTGTNFTFSWFDPSGTRLLKLSGRYHNRKGKPKPNSLFNFARLAELAWSRHYLPRAVEELKQTGYATFPAKGNQFVRIGEGVIEFHLKGEPAIMERQDIKDVRLASGTLTFHHQDAKWYSRSGKYNLAYGQLANARVFLLLLDKLMGYRFTG